MQMSRAACFTYSLSITVETCPDFAVCRLKKYSLLAVSPAVLRRPSFAGRSLRHCCMGHSFQHARVLHGRNVYQSLCFPMCFLLRLVQESVADPNKALVQ